MSTKQWSGLAPKQAEVYYDEWGIKQDTQGHYENRAFEEMLKFANFEKATSVFEFGFGTGKLAKRLLDENLPKECEYHGIDLSQTMLDITRKRLADPYEKRVFVEKSDGNCTIPLQDQSVSHFVSTYVLDLLSPEDVNKVLDEGYRVLQDDGYLCLSGLSNEPQTLSAKLKTTWWNTVWKIKPQIFGGCRPMSLIKENFSNTKQGEITEDKRWEIVCSTIVTAGNLSSEVIVARKK